MPQGGKTATWAEKQVKIIYKLAGEENQAGWGERGGKTTFASRI